MQAFVNAAAQNPSWHWYAIADSAQQKALPDAISKDGGQHRCLLDAPVGSQLAAQAPHLVQLPVPSEGEANWKWIARNVPSLPCATVIASTLEFDPLFEHLKPFTEVLLPDGEDMFFAFWDPAILAVLVGQADDPTLYVKGPVLNPEQRTALTQGMAGWWYWDRDGDLRSVQIETAAGLTNAAQVKALDMPLQLTQLQVDELVEASVPDNLLQNINQNQSHLFYGTANKRRYSYVCQMVAAGRKLGLEGMRDLTNFISLGLIYRERFTVEQTIRELLTQVEQKMLTMDEAMKLMPQ